MEEIRRLIDEHGWYYIYVFDPDQKRTPFAYTIGLEESFKHPEIAIFGLKSETAHAILADIVNEIKSGRSLELHTRLEDIIGGDLDVIFKPINESAYSDYFGKAIDFYKKRFRVQVMLWPDRFNVLPTEAGCQVTIQQDEVLSIIF